MTRYALSGVVYPGGNDVMFGRGGESNYHSGNLNFRNHADTFRERYKMATKGNKPKIAAEVVQAWRNKDPPGRFLTRTDPSSSESVWHDVGNALAIKRATKTLGERSQRERRAEKAARKKLLLESARHDQREHTPSPERLIESTTRNPLECQQLRASPLRMKSHLSPKREELEGDASSSCPSSCETDKKMPATQRNPLPLPPRLPFVGGDASTHHAKSSSSGSSSSISSCTYDVLNMLLGTQRAVAPPTATTDAAMSHTSAVTSEGYVAEELDVLNIPTAAFLVETVFQENEEEKEQAHGDG